MNLIIPNNIFATFFILAIPEDKRPNIIIKESSMVANELNNTKESIALIPSLDLLKNSDLYVSKKLGIGFDGFLTNSYLYFSSTSDDINKLLLKGDISKNEVILSKIILEERYNITPEILLDTNEVQDAYNNYLVTGNQNWQEQHFENGISFDEQIADLLELPYMNFIFASKSESTMNEFNKGINKVNSLILSNLETILEKIALDKGVNNYIKSHINSVCYDLTDNEAEGLQELIKLTYYHQIIDDIFDIKFVE